VDKIRDILFGASMRDYEKRFSRLEEELTKESSDIRDDIGKRFADLETYIRQEIESLSERMTSETRARAESSERLAGDISDLARSAEKRTQIIEDQQTKGQPGPAAANARAEPADRRRYDRQHGLYHLANGTEP
jgi:hypothetical protein